MMFDNLSELVADQLPYERHRMFDLERHFSFRPAEAPRLTLRWAELAGSKLYEVRSTGHDISLIEPELTTVLIPRRGTVKVRTPLATFAARPGETLLFAPNQRATRVIPDQSGVFQCDCLLMPTAAATAEQPAGGLREHTNERVFSSSGSERSDAPLRGFLDYLFGQGTLQDTRLSTARMRMAASILLQELLAELIDRIDEADATGPLGCGRDFRLVHAAEELMAAQLDQPLAMPELAARLGVSARRLQYAFQRVRDATPRTVLGQLRLERARQRLSDPHEKDAVTQIALDCGIAHFGRFAAAYAARFGERPSDTLRRKRRL